jgi:hypothetical protein
MSLCSHTIRAISRSRSQNPKTLLPFLYQTATIQQWKPATRPNPRRNISTRTRAAPSEDVPFVDEDGPLPPTIEEVEARKSRSTITGTERAAFEKLYKTFNSQGQGRKKGDGGEHEEMDQVADEYYEDDEEVPSISLDKVFEEALQGGVPRAQQQYTRVPRPTPTEHSAAGKEASTAEAETPQQKRRLAAKAEKDRVRKLRLEERERIDLLLKSAQTDRQLWDMLTQQVFSRLTKLDLDAPVPPKKDRTKPIPGSKPVRGTRDKKLTLDPSVDTRILFPNYPHHLLTALQVLRVHFPASPLALALLPAIKNLGRASYALGATAQLYKHLLRTAWLQQSSYTLIDTLLSDMEANMIEFDMGILEVLDGVMREHDLARSGRLGAEIKMVVGLESWVEGFEKIKTWRSVVAEKVGVPVDRFPAKKYAMDTTRDDRAGVMDRRQVQRMDSRRDENGRAPPVVFRSIKRTAGGDAIPFVGKEQGFELTNVEAEDIDAESAGVNDDFDEQREEDAGGQMKVML